jgi:anti-sigma factor RsiW
MTWLPEDDSTEEIAVRLREGRAQPTPIELDRAKRRALAGANRSRRTKESTMRSRIALIGVLAAGTLFSGTGAALALSGGDVTSSQAVYSQPKTQPQVLGQQQSGTPTTTPTTTTPQTLPSTQSQPQVQAAQQAAAGSTQSLPFTGLAAIPILVIGVMLIVLGFFLNRRTREQH